MYGRLLRQAYLGYMPWYFRIFMRVGLLLFQDRAFQLAKQKIQSEQKIFGKRNLDRWNDSEKEREQERLDKVNRVRDLALSNKMVEKLDYYYIGQNMIPTVAQVRAELSDIDPETFTRILRARTISNRSGGRRGAAGPTYFAVSFEL